MLRSKRVVTIFIVAFMLLVEACAAPQTNEELVESIVASFREKTNKRIAAGEGDYMAPLYESLSAREYDKAIERCGEYRELRPNDPVIYVLEGLAYHEKGEHSIAVSKFSSAIGMDNTLWPAYLYRALSYMWLGRDQKLLEDLDKLIASQDAPSQITQFSHNMGYEADTEDSISGVIYYLRATTLSGLGETEGALASVDQAIRYNSTIGRHFLLRGDIYSKQQQFVLAYNEFEKAIELSPTDPRAWNSAGIVNLILGKYDRAIVQFEKAIELEAGDSVVITNLGLAYWLQGNQVKAFETMNQALRGEPVDNTYYHIAYFNHLNGRQNKALEYFQKSYEINHNILKDRTLKMNATPATSPTRNFYGDELVVAERYLTTGSTPEENAYKNRPPTLEITSVTLDPNPVRVNTPFDFHVSYKVDVPNSSENSLPTVLKFTILRGNKTLFSSEPYHMDANNGESKKWALHMNPVPKKGAYTIKVIVKHQKLTSEQSIELLIN